MAKLVNFRKKKQILKITKPYHSAKVIEQFLREFGIRLKKRRTDRQTRVKPKPHSEKWGSKKKKTNKQKIPSFACIRLLHKLPDNSLYRNKLISIK